MRHMRGDLSETSVADLCRGLSDAESTGAVELEGPTGDARVFFRKGDVYWAVSPAPRARLGDRLVNAGLLSQDQLDQVLEEQRTASERTKLGALLVEQGLVTRDVIRVFVQEQILDALFDLMRYHDGGYVFRPGEAVDEKLPIDIPVDQLLVEVSRRQNEWDQIEDVIPDLDMVPDFVTGGSSANAALEPDEFAVLASVDGRRSIRDLAEDLGYSEFELARIVYGLTLLGIVDVRPGEDEDEADEDIAPDEPAAGAAAESELEIDLDDLVAAAGLAEEDADAPADEPTADVDAGEGEGESEDEDEVDIAAALEEALSEVGTPLTSGTEDEPPQRPQVKVHVDDDVSSYVAPRTIEPGVVVPPGVVPTAPDAETDETEPEVAEVEVDEVEAEITEPAATEPEAEDGGEPVAAEVDGPGASEPAAPEPGAPSDDDALARLTDALSSVLGSGAQEDDAPVPTEPAPEPVDEVDEPEPWVASDEDLDFDFFAAPRAAQDGDTDEPAATSGDVPEPAEDSTPRVPLDDADFDALLDQLAGAPEGSTDDTPPPPRPTSPPERAAEEPSQAPEPAPSSSGRGGGGAGDVSEFLRELSRLALDDDAGPPPEVPEQEQEPEPSDANAAANAAANSREEDRRQAADRRAAEDKKKRGLFGWGR